MSDQPNQANHPQNLSEISHLFLSSVRDRQTSSSERPRRIPPSERAQMQAQATVQTAVKPQMSIDLTPEEFATVLGSDLNVSSSDVVQVAPMTAIIASHLNAQQYQRSREYAGHLCRAMNRRVGLIEVDGGEFRVSCFERNPNGVYAASEPASEQGLDPRVMNECLDEMSWDVERWLLLLPNLSSNEARSLLRHVKHWVLLATCDHDGIVSCYRTLKGLAELHAGEGVEDRPRLSVALLDALDEAHAARVVRKLAGVCQQFLGWPLEQEEAVREGPQIAEHLVVNCRGHHDKAALANGPQWQVVSDFISRCGPDEPSVPTTLVDTTVPEAPAEPAPQPQQMKMPDPQASQHASLHASLQASRAAMHMTPVNDAPEVVDLPMGDTTPASIVSAVVKGDADLIECSIKPPMCTDASLAVSRDRKLMLIAVAQQGLQDLRQIGKAYQWLLENRALLKMALPQLSIDAHQLPELHLLVDHADTTADILQPMLQSASVRVHAYRKLRWGGKTGLLLEAA